MTQPARQVLEDALRLARKDRARLAAELLRSLGDEAFGPPDDEWQKSWAAEVERRVREIDEGKAELVDGDVFLDRLEAKLRK